MRPWTRRGVLAGGLGLLAAPAQAAPTPAETGAWIAYEARLRARLADAGGGAFDADGARDVLALTNRVRRQAGSPPLAWDDELAAAARAHAGDLAHRGYFEHLSPEQFDPSHRFWLIGRRTIGSPSENLAHHRGGPQVEAGRLMDIWRGSRPHWTNHLRRSHTHAGFGLLRIADRSYLVGLYARPVARLPEPLPFRPRGEEFARAFGSLPAGLKPGVGTPQGSDWEGADGPPKVMQLSVQRPLDGRRFEIIGGPIFVEPT